MIKCSVCSHAELSSTFFKDNYDLWHTSFLINKKGVAAINCQHILMWGKLIIHATGDEQVRFSAEIN